jgi:ABC-type nitrate/sulfonate/bicarbonate transport system substrate-binding protein
MSGKRHLNRAISRREFLRGSMLTGVGAGTAWLLAACSSVAMPAPAPTQAPAAAATPIPPTVTAAPAAAMPAETPNIIHGTYNPNWANTVLNELADHFGWLKEEGIEKQEIIIVDQTQIFPGLIGGSLLFAQQDTDAVAGANLQGEPLRFIATYRNKEPWIFGVGKGIETVEDLYGKQVSGGAAGSRNEFNGKEMIRRLGGDPEKMEWVPVSGGSDSRVEAVNAGVIAGTVMFDRHRPLILNNGGKILFDDLEEVPQDCFCVHENWLKANERTVVAFLKATTRARIFFHDLNNKDEIISIMESRGYEFSADFKELYPRDLAINSPTGQFDIKAMEKLIADSVNTGNLEKEIDWKEFTRMDYLNQAYKELGMDDQVVSYS